MFHVLNLYGHLGQPARVLRQGLAKSLQRVFVTSASRILGSTRRTLREILPLVFNPVSHDLAGLRLRLWPDLLPIILVINTGASFPFAAWWTS